MRRPTLDEASLTGTSVVVLPDAESLALAAAAAVVAEARRAVRRSGMFTIALSGGSTPEPVYRLLAGPPFRDFLPWGDIHVFFSDERCVDRDDPRSNEGMARRALLDLVPMPPEQVHAMTCPVDNAGSSLDVALDAARAAADKYEDLLRSPAAAVRGGRLDLVLLGLGTDGHTASLFPGSDVLDEQVRWAAACRAPYAGGPEATLWRVTLTAPFINQATTVLFLVSGAAKAAAVKEVIQGDADPQLLPARLIRPPGGRLCWLLDDEAASGLDLAGDSAGLSCTPAMFIGKQGAE